MIYFAVFLLVISVILLVNCVELAKSQSAEIVRALTMLDKINLRLYELDELNKNTSFIIKDLDRIKDDLAIVRRSVLKNSK